MPLLIQSVKESNESWVNSSPSFAGDTQYLDDEQHGETKQEHAPLWLEILDRYKEPASSTIVGLGNLVVSLVIELSQWEYPIVCVTNVYSTYLRAERDAQIQAGEFRKLYHFNFFHTAPKGAVITFIGIAEHLRNEQLFVWLDMLVHQCREIIFPVPVGRDWYGLLSSRYDTVVKRYPNGKYDLIIIKNIYEEQFNAPQSRREVGTRRKDSSTKSPITLSV